MTSKKRIGFIGAGKVGFSLGRYFKEHHMDVSGYYSRNPSSAKAAAQFTQTQFFDKLEYVVGESEVIFTTVPDTMISVVWEQLKQHQIKEKIVCHCSGALTSDIFSDMDVFQVYGYSIHPLFAIHDHFNSYKELSKCLFTIEGNEKYLAYFKVLFEEIGNTVQIIPKQEKVRYHMAAAMASNLMIALVHICNTQFELCGFTAEGARKALTPILLSNMQHIIEDGCVSALTGPLERCDIGTIQKHLEVLKGNEKEVYKTLSRALIEVAKQKNPERHYDQMEEVLE